MKHILLNMLFPCDLWSLKQLNKREQMQHNVYTMHTFTEVFRLSLPQLLNITAFLNDVQFSNMVSSVSPNILSTILVFLCYNDTFCTAT
jgi:hypothetical protein